MGRPGHVWARLLPLLAVAWLYLPAVGLQFFWDDIIHWRYAQQSNPQTLLTEADFVAYYRPLVNLALWAWLPLEATPTPALWHFLLVANHLINTALLGAWLRALRLPGPAQVAGMAVFWPVPVPLPGRDLGAGLVSSPAAEPDFAGQPGGAALGAPARQ
ncbi:MAG: hypothetical protein HC915_20510, partial [Anaerolineae bacterium]|nr:hypothetical protein [Anaerolineae bacterium]